MIKSATPTRSASRGQSAVGTLFYLLLGPIVWVMHFTALYATQSTFCSLAPIADAVSGMNTVTTFVALATGVAFFLLSVVMLKADTVCNYLRADGWPRSQRTFNTRVMSLMVALALFAIAAAALAAIFIDTCSQLR